MVFYCPHCWGGFAEDFRRCPNCGQPADEVWEGKDYVEKLILALNHPEPQTPIRAAGILGELGDARAEEPLIALVEASPDPYIARAAVSALGRLATPRARRFLEVVKTRHPAVLVRVAAASSPDENLACERRKKG